MEKLCLSAARFSLGVHNRTPIAAIRGELGLFPLGISIVENMSKYYQRLLNTDKDSLLGDAFLSNQKLNNSWMNSYDSICKSFGLPHSVPPGIMKKTMESIF